MPNGDQLPVQPVQAATLSRLNVHLPQWKALSPAADTRPRSMSVLPWIETKNRLRCVGNTARTPRVERRPMTLDTPPSDAELVLRCRSGERFAWETLVRRYQRLIYAVPRRAGLSGEQAADVFQTVFARLLEHLHRLTQPDRIHAWLVTCARRETLRMLAEGRRCVTVGDTSGEGPDVFEAVVDPAPLPDEMLIRVELGHRVRLAIERLDERSRALVTLLFLQEEPLPYAEIARRLGVSEGSIGPTRARCLAKLRALLAEEP